MTNRRRKTPTDLTWLPGERFSQDDRQPQVFRGIAAKWDTLALDRDPPTVIARGAFRKTITEQGRRVRILLHHDPTRPIGVPVEMREGEDGLVIAFRLSESAEGEAAAQLIRDGVLTDLSVGFDVMKHPVVPVSDVGRYVKSPLALLKLADLEQQGVRNVRVILEVRLWEVSLVTFAALDGSQLFSKLDQKRAEDNELRDRVAAVLEAHSAMIRSAAMSAAAKVQLMEAVLRGEVAEAEGDGEDAVGIARKLLRLAQDSTDPDVVASALDVARKLLEAAKGDEQRSALDVARKLLEGAKGQKRSRRRPRTDLERARQSKVPTYGWGR